MSNPSIRNYNTRWANTIRTPSVRLDICKRSYFYKGITLWNKLDKKIQDSKSIDIFKKKCEILPIPDEQFISYLYFLTISKYMLSLPFIFNLSPEFYLKKRITNHYFHYCKFISYLLF